MKTYSAQLLAEVFDRHLIDSLSDRIIDENQAMRRVRPGLSHFCTPLVPLVQAYSLPTAWGLWDGIPRASKW